MHIARAGGPVVRIVRAAPDLHAIGLGSGWRVPASWCDSHYVAPIDQFYFFLAVVDNLLTCNIFATCAR